MVTTERDTEQRPTAPPCGAASGTADGEYPFNYLTLGRIARLAETPIHRCGVAVVMRCDVPDLRAHPAPTHATATREFVEGTLRSTARADGAYELYHPGFPDGRIVITKEHANDLPGVLNIVFR